MKTIYYYLRNIIKYGIESEHVVYSTVCEDLMVLSFNHVSCSYAVNFDDDLIVRSSIDPAKVNVVFNNPDLKYLGAL